MAKDKTHQLLRLWDYLKGTPEKFSLQSRIYHSVCVATMLVIFYNIPFSLWVGLPKMALLSTGLFLLQLYFYYLSRFKDRLHTSMIIYSVIIQIFFGIDFYFSSGIQGATLYSFSVTYFLIIAMAKRQHYWYWTLGNLAVVIGLVIYEYHHPEVVHYRYSSRSSQFTDIASTYVVNMILIFSCLTYIINNYTLEKKIAEENAVAMTRLNEEKNKLISIVSHDFRAPLRNFQGYLNILKKTDLNAADRDRLQDELSRTTDEAQRLLDNLLSWTIKQMEKTNYELSSFNLLSCLNEVFDYGKLAATAKGIEFLTDIRPDLMVTANQDLLQLMVRNLVNNAIKFTHSGGTITVEAVIVPDGCLLRLSDTGKGIDEADQLDIFTLDIRSSFGTDGEKGVGLGLVLCKEFADSQNINISFESKPDVGTAFSLVIPAESLPHPVLL